MQSVRTILVGVDLSSPDSLVSEEIGESMQAVISQAIELAEAAGAELIFCSVLTITPPETEALVEQSAESLLIEDASSILKQIAAEAHSRGIPTQTRVLLGKAWEELIRDVIRNEIDLLVIGPHHHNAAQRLIFGSTVIKILRKCPCPVWVARPETGDPDRRTVLVADDFTDVGEHALHMGVSAAQYKSARLVVIHAVEFPLDHRLFRTGIQPEEIEAYRERIVEQAQETLHERLSGTDYRTIPAGVIAEIMIGQPDTVIEDAIHQYDATLLVMGTVARGGLQGLLLGNTAERLLTRIPCSLLALKPDDFQSPVTP